MTITERTADVRRRLDEIEATAGLPKWSKRKEHLIRRCLAEAAALSGELDHLLVYLEKGWTWFDRNQPQRGQPEYEKKHDAYMKALDAHTAAQDALRDALRLCVSINEEAA